MRHYLCVGAMFIKMSIQCAIEYPMRLVGWLLANPIQFIIGFATIRFVVQNFGTLGGWDYKQIAFLYGLAVISHGFSIVLCIQFWYMGWYVVGGEFDLYLTRPMSVLFQYCFDIFNVIGVTDLIPGFIIFFYGCAQVEFKWTLYNLVAVIAVTIGALLIRGAVYLITGCTAFWTRSTNQLSDFFTGLFDRMTHYPMTIYPRVIQIIFTFILPFGFISFYPASAFIGGESGFSFPPSAIWLTLGIGILMFALACFVFSRGLRQYDSAGS